MNTARRLVIAAALAAATIGLSPAIAAAGNGVWVS